MNKTVKADLSDMSSAIESIGALLHKLSRAEKVDVGAHINAIKNAAEKLDKAIKDDIEKWQHEKAGVVKGETFKAVLAYYSVTRLNQTKLKEDEPDIHSSYCETNNERRIVYMIR